MSRSWAGELRRKREDVLTTRYDWFEPWQKSWEPCQSAGRYLYAGAPNTGLQVAVRPPMHRHVMALHAESLLPGGAYKSIFFWGASHLQLSISFSKPFQRSRGRRTSNVEPAAQPSHLFNYILFQMKGRRVQEKGKHHPVDPPSPAANDSVWRGAA